MNADRMQGTRDGKTNSASWFHRRKTAIVFVSLFSIVTVVKLPGLLLWARIRILTSLPKTAIADDPTQPLAQAKPPTDLDTGLAFPESSRVGVRADPFQVDGVIFSPTPITPPTNASTPGGKLAVPVAIEVPSAEDAHRAAVESAAAEVASLRLQSAGRGLSLAVIDGRTYRIGDSLTTASGLRCTLVEILDGSAVLECELNENAANPSLERFELRLRGYSPRIDAIPSIKPLP